LYTFARENMRASSMVGGKFNRANYANHNAIFAVMNTMQQYTLSYYTMYFRQMNNALRKIEGVTPQMRKNAQKAFAVSTFSQAAVAGLFGLPGVGIVQGILSALHPDMDLEKEMRDMLTDDDDPASYWLGELAVRGFFNSALQIDWSSRTSMNQLLGFNEYSGFDPWNLGGPVPGLVRDGVMGVADVLQGNMGKGIVRMMPNVLKKPLELAQNDGEISLGRDITTPADSTEQLLHMFGFTPNRVSRAKRAMNMIKASNDMANERRQRVYETIFENLQNGRYALVQKAMNDYLKTNVLMTEQELLQGAIAYGERKMYGYDMMSEGSTANPGETGRIASMFGMPTGPAVPETERLGYRDQMRGQVGLRPSSFRDRLKAQRLARAQRDNELMTRTELRSAGY
jgi:hypothetical protein